MFSNKLIAGGLAALMLALGVGAALAAPGEAIATVNVRAGPGTHYKVVSSLKAGDPVDIQKCVSGWCYVGKAGTDGWVAQGYLQRLARPIIAPPPIVVRPPIIVRPPVHHRPPHHIRPPYHRPPHHRPPVKPRPIKPPVCKPGMPNCLIKPHS